MRVVTILRNTDGKAKLLIHTIARMRVDLIIFIRNNKVIHHLFILRISLGLVTRGQHSKCEMRTFPNFGMFKMYSAFKGFADPFADGKSETYSVCVHLGSALKFAKILKSLP